MDDPHPVAVRSVSLWDLFTGFLTIGLMGFGGIAASAHYVIVERRQWLGPKEFVEMFGICSILPGGNFMNVTIMVGDRYKGVLGAAIAMAGLFFFPLVILVGIASTYDHFSYLPDVRAATDGAAAAAAGLILSTTVRMGRGVTWTIAAMLICGLTFVMVGLLRFPLWSIVLTMVPVSIGTVYLTRRWS